MNELVTVATFTYPPQAAVIKARLESEGITCYMKDELTAQINPFYSAAIGGVKIQVRQSDVIEAVKILKEIGYIQYDEAEEEMTFLKRLAAPAQYIPFIRNYSLEARLAILGTGIALIITLILYFLFL